MIALPVSIGAAVPFVPDAPVAPLEPPGATDFGEAGATDFGAMLRNALDAASSALDRAGRAESAFRAGRGGLQEMVVERAQADVVLAMAAAAASHATQSLSTLLNMQV